MRYETLISEITEKRNAVYCCLILVYLFREITEGLRRKAAHLRSCVWRLFSDSFTMRSIRSRLHFSFIAAVLPRHSVDRFKHKNKQRDIVDK